MDWYEDFIPYLKTSPEIRLWFMENHLLKNQNLFSELLLECPSPDVRHAFSKIIVFLIHYSLIGKSETSLGMQNSYYLFIIFLHYFFHQH